MSATDSRAGPGSPAPKRPVLALFTSHWLAMTGLGLLLTAIVLWACVLGAELRSGAENPYVGLAMVVVGVVFAIGLLLTPIGLHFGRRRVEQRMAATMSEGRGHWRRLLVFLAIVSLVNVAIASQLTLRVVHHMESRQFCGSCHVMTPEARAFEVGAHAGILCVDCHVGEGARGFVQSKLQGTRQLIQVLKDEVPKPIHGAIESGRMIPSNETCENCHWKQQPAKASLKLIRRYAEDEANTPETTLLTMNVGGARMGGIHGAHHGDGVEIRFVAADAKRLEIPLVEYTNKATGVSRTYVKAGKEAASFAGQPRIQMQCFDCHNRPAHSFQMPDRAVDQAISLGRVAADLPFLKKTAVAVLKAGYASSADAAAKIPAAIEAYYQASHPNVARDRAAEVREAGQVVAELYSRNVFPEYGVDWGTYPDFRGHETSPGCYRCHDGEHVAATGEKITKDCFRCHYPSAVKESKPEVLELLGVDNMLRKLQQKR